MRAIAGFCYDKRRFIVAGWVLLLVALSVFSGVFGGEFKTDFSLPGSESQAAFDLLKEKGATDLSGYAGQVVFKSEGGVDQPAVRAAMEAFFADIEASVRDTSIASPYQPEHAYQVSPDRKIAYAQINFSERKQEEYLANGITIKDIWRDISVPGLQVELGGDIFADVPNFSSEGLGIIAAVIIMLIAFGSLLAMGLPLVTALVGIGCGMAIVALLTRFLSMPNFMSQVAIMIGIGVGIDYALMIVTRYRAELHGGKDPRAATITALDTSGRAVIFAGTTVVISLVGIFMMRLAAMQGMAGGAVSAVLMTMLASVTLLPALLGFVGKHIDRLALPSRHKGREHGDKRTFWYRWSRVIQAHPWPSLVISLGLLLVLAMPAFSVRLGFSDPGNRQDTDTTRRAYDMLTVGFGPGFNSPIIVITQGPGGQPPDMAAAGTLGEALRGAEGVQSVAGPIPIANGELALFTLFPLTSPQDKGTADLVHRLRDVTIPAATAGNGLRALTSGGPRRLWTFPITTASTCRCSLGPCCCCHSSFLWLSSTA
ncbi:MAG: MMPL family transporter [SAR202 cluster bacterium]|nr:MMPL family transporter [SAR202 cluster bacterium]